MSPFMVPKKKLMELLVLLVVGGIFYVVYPSVDAITLFAFGFVWNWAASNDLSVLFENRRYRLSMLKMVVNVQNLILKPFEKTPDIFKRLVAVFPAGLFWALVIFINDSDMPWWSTFLGSLAFELLQLELKLFHQNKGQP